MRGTESIICGDAGFSSFTTCSSKYKMKRHSSIEAIIRDNSGLQAAKVCSALKRNIYVLISLSMRTSVLNITTETI
jgi:hypothetical protein